MAVERRRFLKELGLSPIVLWSTDASGQFAAAAQADSGSAAPHLGLLTPRRLEADILVAGGGLSGVCAALAAARNGSSVILVQNRSRLGGNSSSEIRMHVLGANSQKDLGRWRETGIIEEFKLTDSACNLQRSFEMWDLMLYDKVVSEPNLQLMLDTFVVGARVQGEQVVSAMAVSPLVEESYEIAARLFLDCTGDATLAAAAEAEYMWGREARSTYGESLAPEQADRKTMGNTILFFSREHDRPMHFRKPAWARGFTAADFKHRPINSWDYGYWWIEWGGELDTIRDNQKIRHELLRNLFGIWDYIKNSGNYPASANWALDWVGMLPGKRENRRVRGEHVLVESDLIESRLHGDRVAYGGWPIDDHPPGGIGQTDVPPTSYIYFKQPYSVPLRSLYSINRPNLLMAGRNISASHVAFASTRVMATCATFGQAAGTAAVFCLQHQCLPRDVVKSPVLLRQLQQLLLRDDQALLGIRNEDPADLGRHARVTACCETGEGRATYTVDGVNRDVGDGISHQWQAPFSSGPPWIELRWDQPQVIRLVQVTFDTGLHRKLYISGQNNEYYSQTRGPQPETVADFSLEIEEAGGQFGTVARISDNFLRLVRVEVPEVQTRAIRIQVFRTQGDPLARIFEIRCYGKATGEESRSMGGNGRGG
jgi:hypothetical protein